MRKITIPLKNVRGKDKFGKILTESVHRGHDKQGGAVFIQCIVAKKSTKETPYLCHVYCFVLCNLWKHKNQIYHWKIQSFEITAVQHMMTMAVMGSLLTMR